MGRIFVSVGYGSLERRLDPSGISTAKDLIMIRDLVVTELRSRGFEVISVPDELGTEQTVRWINSRDRVGDIALEVHADAHANAAFRGTGVYYIANNSDRKQHADLILLALTRRLPQLAIRGALPDTSSALGQVSFCRQLVPASLYLQIGFLTNADDRSLIQTRRQEIALGIADGLASWSRTVSEGYPADPTLVRQPAPPPAAIPVPININVNGRTYGELGMIVNGNAYIPVDLADRMGMTVTNGDRRVSHGNVVYLKAIDLRNADISVVWDAPTRTVSIRSILQISRPFHEISGRGYTSEVQMLMFLKANHDTGLSQFPDIARLYRDEGSNEGINYDIAFAQMCVETDFLRFGGTVKPGQNNFGGLGTGGGTPEGASFPSARIGVRAHIQHLKAYANAEPLREEVVDPRFNLVTRSIAPTIKQLSGRWSSDSTYGDRILAIVRQLYEAAGLL